MKTHAAPVIAFKTLAPSVDAAIARPAALAAMRAAAAPARWLTGPSGSGKSTLVASHVRASRRKCAWYRIDARDDDPAFFYAHFGAAITAAFPGKATLPRFGDEDHADEDGYSARFVTAVMKRVGSGAVVLDDVHKASRPALLGVLARLVASTERGEIWLVGEHPPGAPFFDAIGARKLALCNDVQLAFSAGECAALAAASRVKTVDGAQLAALTGGHAGALVLACEMLRDARQGTESARRAEEIHLHLLTRLVDGMPPARRELVLGTAFAPYVTHTLAEALAGAGAADELSTLHSHGLLRRAEGPRGDVYEAHGLVRRGVQTLVRTRLGEHGARERALATATALAAHGYEDEAFALLAEHGEAQRAAELLATIAPRHARTGQAALLLRALDQLPAAVIDAHPWLPFWAGEALLGIDEEAARTWFARAHDAFEVAGDAHGRRVAAARVITAYGLEYGDLRGLDAWMERYVAAGGDEAIASGAEHETALCVATMCAAIVRGAYPPGYDAEALLRRVRVLIEMPDAWLTPDEPVAAARLLIDDARIFRGPEQSQAMVTGTRSIADRADAGALQRGRWCVSAAIAYASVAQHEPAKEYFELAEALVTQTASRRLAFELGMARIDAELKRNDVEAAAVLLDALERLARNAPPGPRADHARLAARVALQRGRPQEGLRWAEEAVAGAALAGYSGANARVFQLECIYALAANERHADALAVIRPLLQGLDGRQSDAARVLADVCEYLSTGEQDIERLSSCLTRAAGIGFVNLLARARAPLARVCRAALAHEIEPVFVRRIIAQHNLSPPPLAGPEWPYAVHVRTLGAFELRVAGVTHRPAHKGQDKPLDLLKLLIACQAMGRASADKDWLAERLWPEADVQNARKSLDMTVIRLRRLVDCEDAVTVAEGRVALAVAHVWTDVAPLMRALANARSRRDDKARGLSIESNVAAAEVTAVLDHFRGPFLPEEPETPWLMAGREAIASAVRAALLIADMLLAGNDDRLLLPALERAFAADPTSEDLARALMRALGRAGQQSEVLRVYRRLRDMLSIVLGVTPSAQTQELHAKIMSGARTGGAPGRASLTRTPSRP